MPMPRREMLYRCLATGVLSSLLPADSVVAAMLEGEKLAPTPRVEVGPFFKRGSPERRRIVAPAAAGVPLLVEGRVLDTRGEVVPGAVIEVWQADHFGEYDLTGYDCRGHVASDPKGAYAFESVIPGHYPARVAQHVHYLVTAPGHRALSTQLYFATDSAFEGDPAKNYRKDPLVESASLIRPVTLEPKEKGVLARTTFELVMERA